MMNENKTFTFYFFDYETFGINPAIDRPAQFAGIRTDSDFNPIEPPLTLYCQPADDYLPDPQAVLITGITPQIAQQHGVCEAEFSKQIHAAFSQPNSCILGYNNIRFDDEITRYLFYRNFFDPYGYSWQNSNSRWDLLDVVRCYYALRPDGINWPLNDQGFPSFKLEHLTVANQLEHVQAHDAMSDGYATIAIAKLLKEKQPKLFDYLFKLRHKKQVMELINIAQMTPLVHISGMLGAYRGNTTWISPINWHPQQSNAVICCDLAGNIDTLIELDIPTIKEQLYTKSSEQLSANERIPLKLVHCNKCPVLAPAKMLSKENAARLNINREMCLLNLSKLKKYHQLIREKVTAVFADPPAYPVSNDVDEQLYSHFFNHHDLRKMALIPHSAKDQLVSFQHTFTDERLQPLLFRYRARNYPETLNKQEQLSWSIHCQKKLNPHYLENYLLLLNQQVELNEHEPEKLALLKSLFIYYQHIIALTF